MKNYGNQKSKLDLKKISIAKLDRSSQRKIMGGTNIEGDGISGLGTEADWTIVN